MFFLRSLRKSVRQRLLSSHADINDLHDDDEGDSDQADSEDGDDSASSEASNNPVTASTLDRREIYVRAKLLWENVTVAQVTRLLGVYIGDADEEHTKELLRNLKVSF